MRGNRRVVVTGMGVISPVGNSAAAAWKNIVEGNSGIGPITNFDASDFACQIAGEVRNFDVENYLSAKEARKIDPFMHYGLAAGIDAMKDSGLEVTDANRTRIGCAIAAGIGGIKTIEDNHAVYLERGPRRISPFFVPGTIINMIAGNLSIRYGLQGPNIAIVSACTTATHNIGQAARMIAYDEADAMVAGGAEHATTPIGVGGFTAARAMSTRNDAPTKASRPWDADRDGFVLSDGAAMLVLEERDQAMARGANIYAEVVGFGMSADAYHITSPSEDGSGAARCMENALEDASINPREVNYINAHATSTSAGDVAETRAIKTVFGDHAYDLAVSGTKSTTGHLLGAAGGIEAVASIMALRDQVLPPTINLENPDQDCDLDYVPNTARDARLNVVLSNSFGFGGTNGCLIFTA